MKKQIIYFKAIILFVMTLFTVNSQGHGGDHGAPEVKPKIAGAQIRKNEVMFLEVVYQDKNIKIYPFALDQTPLSLEKVKISASLELPKKKDLLPLTLDKQSDHFVANFDPKGIHRLTVIIKTEDAQRDTFKYTFEPKK